MPDEKPEVLGVFHSLPLISELPKKEMKQAQSLLEEYQALNEAAKTTSERMDEIKDLLSAIQNKAKLTGFRYGGLCFRERKMEGRESLDRHKLIENGVDPEVIKASMKVGKEYVQREFKEINTLVNGEGER